MKRANCGLYSDMDSVTNGTKRLMCEDEEIIYGPIEDEPDEAF